MVGLAHKIMKIIFFLFVMMVIGRFLGDPYTYTYTWLNHSFVYWIAGNLYGNEDVGAESIENVFFVIGFTCMLVLATIIYKITFRLIHIYRNKN
ncbi:hypothetical protein [Rosenbergiella nectarea]|uniref:hypothetical protein n=1 Tax=Rosenbergiella nectarea TaxID=988801 RepID=UPI001F4DB34A|nr:hypothetical protein [Rosenbergiella nectarea]